jgi:hypothetical protein
LTNSEQVEVVTELTFAEVTSDTFPLEEFDTAELKEVYTEV